MREILDGRSRPGLRPRDGHGPARAAARELVPVPVRCAASTADGSRAAAAFVLWTALAVGFVGVDTRRALGFMLFALAAPPLLVALVTLLALASGRARVGPASAAAHRRPAGHGPAGRRRAGRTCHRAALALLGRGRCPRTGSPVSPAEATLEADGDAADPRARSRSGPGRRGRYELPRLRARGDGRLRAWCARGRCGCPGETLLVYPRYFTFGELPLPMGRRYQPGGIPLASEVGDSLEFIGTREYREGDPLRKIHWRSWARRRAAGGAGVPGGVLLAHRTRARHLPARRARGRASASASRRRSRVLASIADHFSRSEEVVDILAAGPDLYEVSTGRSLGYLDNVLDVLACLEPSPAAALRVDRPGALRAARAADDGRGRDARVGRGARGLRAARSRARASPCACSWFTRGRRAVPGPRSRRTSPTIAAPDAERGRGASSARGRSVKRVAATRPRLALAVALSAAAVALALATLGLEAPASAPRRGSWRS